jgi:uncharacterized protein DUF2510
MSDIPAGWQPDPRGRHEYRYWDGNQWTDHVSDQGQVSSDPVADASPPAAEEGDPKSAIFTPESATESASEPTAESTPPAAAATTEPEPTAVQPTPAAAESDVPASTPPAGGEEAAAPATPTPAAATATPPASSSAPPGGTTVPATAHTDAKAAAQDMLRSRSPELATILSAVVPGSGHFYMGTDKVPLAAGLVIATIAAVVISHISFLMFIIGFVVWLAAAAFALTDLRGGVRGIEDTVLPKNVVGILLIGAGALLILSLLLPWYRITLSAEAFGQSASESQSFSGFTSLELIDIILLVIGVAAIVAGAASLGLGPVTSAELPRWMPTAVAVGGAIATVLILFRMFVDPAGDASFGFGVKADVDVGRAFGIWIALWSALVLLIANAGLLRSLSNQQRQSV